MIHARIFKANDIRGIATGPDPEWDAAGAYAIGAATADVFEISAGSGALVVGPRHADHQPGALRGLRRRGAEPWCRRGRHRSGQHRRAVVRLRLARSARRDVHRQPQPRELQRDQVLPPGCAAGRAGGAGGDPRARPGRWRRSPPPGRAPGPSGTCSAAYADHLLSLVDLSGHPPAQGRRRCRQRDGRADHRRPSWRVRTWRSSGSTSTWTAASRTTRRTRWSRPTWWTPRRRCASTAPIWRWCSTVTPTAAS